jgi:hypothetical protein
MIMPKSGRFRLSYSRVTAPLPLKLHGCGREDTSEPQTRTAAAFGTALRIASALGVA